MFIWCYCNGQHACAEAEHELRWGRVVDNELGSELKTGCQDRFSVWNPYHDNQSCQCVSCSVHAFIHHVDCGFITCFLHTFCYLNKWSSRVFFCYSQNSYLLCLYRIFKWNASFCRHEQIIESLKGLNMRTYMLAKNIVEPAQAAQQAARWG